jgi:hypothetical protein
MLPRPGGTINDDIGIYLSVKQVISDGKIGFPRLAQTHGQQYIQCCREEQQKQQENKKSFEVTLHKDLNIGQEPKYSVFSI